MLAPEVDVDPGGARSWEGTRTSSSTCSASTILVVAGQAKSHCVAWTVADLLAEIEARDPSLARRVLLLDDCSSAVCVPGVVDYTDAADDAYRRFAAAGMRRARSTELA